MCPFLERTTQELEIEKEGVIVIEHQLLGRHFTYKIAFNVCNYSEG